ncbi:MAG: DUF4139 domain-containing protein [Candidatus Omnitrophica bacterium]|nr:DUF4139 domain-containing protein [Candidatus Omnitrophota bacterium]
MALAAIITWVGAGGALAGQAAVLKSTAEDQLGLEVTVYNSNLGLIKDTRRVELAEGQGQLWFMDVASQIMPVTVHARSLDHPEEFTVLEQNYEYDLMNEDKLLDKYVGKKIKILTFNDYQDRKEMVEAQLLANNQGQIYRINGEIYLGHPGTKILPEIPENLIAKPTLSWLYQAKGRRPHQLEVSYLTQGITWKADYVLLLNQEDTAADLAGWVTVDNQSGATYREAKLKLVAGQVHRAEEELLEGMAYARRGMAAEAVAPQFEERGLFEYHLYDLARRTTIKENQAKQIGLLEAPGAGVEKELLVQGVPSYLTSSIPDRLEKQPVWVYVKLKNSKENHLGMPLPAGVVRLYKKDSQGSLQFVGEDRIRHTPRDEEVKLKVGEAFDLAAERVQTDYRQVSSRLYETEWEITLRNHKEEAVTVGVIEPMQGSWQVVSNSYPYTKVDAFTIRFDLTVPKDQEVKLRYRVRVGL